VCWIEWPPVIADVWAVAVVIEQTLGAVVAGLAKRLQGAGHKLIPVAMVGDDVIGNASDGDHAPGGAHGAQGVRRQLGSPPPTPAFELVPLTPGASLR
jgi:hypothetical protein